MEEKVCEVQNDLQAIFNTIAEPDLRVCTNTTALKNSPSLSAITLGHVTEYQIISVIRLPEEQSRKKWLYVTYFDVQTGESKAGWVLQKYFKRNKVTSHH